MRCKEKLELYLRQHDIHYGIQHHPKVFTSQEVAATGHIPGKQLAKVVMAFAGSRLAMLVLPASEHVYLPEVARLLGAEQIRLADEWEFASVFPDCEVGAMPPFGNLYEVPVYVDAALARSEYIYFQAGSHTDTFSMRYDDFARLVQPTVIAMTLEELLSHAG